jgi:hypothetical protein
VIITPFYTLFSFLSNLAYEKIDAFLEDKNIQ